jgi:hypothetical protein
MEQPAMDILERWTGVELILSPPIRSGLLARQVREAYQLAIDAAA